MENPITTTLFRFVSFRNPQLPDEASLQNKFVNQPEALKTGVFYDAVADRPSNTTKRAALRQAAAVFSKVFTSQAEIVALSQELYDFSVWLIRNRSTCTDQELQDQAGAAGLDDIKLQDLWDNFFYQTVTQKSFYLKESIMQMLLADHVAKKINRTGLKEFSEYNNQLINARIVLPVELFDETYETTDEQPNIPALREIAEAPTVYSPAVPDKYLRRQLELSRADFELNKFRVLKSELEYSEKVYNKEYAAAYDESYARHKTVIDPILEEYNEQLNNAQKAYCEVRNPDILFDPADPCQQPDYVPYPKFQDFKFSYTEQVTADKMQNELSPDSYNTLLGLLGYDFNQNGPARRTADTSGSDVFAKYNSYQSIHGLIDSATDNSYKQIAQNARLFPSKVSIGGFVVPFGTKSTQQAFDFMLCVSNPTPSSIWSIFSLTISVPDTSWEIFSIETNAIFPDSDTTTDTVTNPAVLWSGTVIQLNAFFKFPFLNGKNTGNVPYLNIEVQFYNGTKKRITNVDAAMVACIKGSVAEPGSGTDNPGEGTENTVNPPFHPSGFGFKNVGVAEYKKVEQTVQCYVEGEVSHIENVMAREYKEKSTRSLRRSEDTTTTSSETEQEKLSDTTTANRFEMQSEISKVLQESQDFAGFVNAGYSGDKFSLNTGLSYANNTSKEDSIRQAVTQSKEITERALDRVVQKVKEERVTKIVEEYEENNKHGFDNRQGSNHVVGVYRWVDKLYKNRIYNYGIRTMFEFMVPEPAKLHLLGMTETSESDDTVLLSPPVDPRKYSEDNFRVSDASALTDARVAYWAAVYNAEIEARPENTITVGDSFNIKLDGISKLADVEANSGNGKIIIPDGYRAISAIGIFNAVSDNRSGGGRILSLSVGNKTVTYGKAFESYTLYLNTELSDAQSTVTQGVDFAASQYANEIPVSYTLGNHASGDISVSIKCVLSESALMGWRQTAFKAILDAYEEALSQYNEQLKAEQAKAATIKATNPGFYRQIENIVLRKNCISYLIDQNPNALNTYGRQMDNNIGTFEGYEVNVNQSLNDYASFVKFIEQAFEWEIMSYNFYPYYWGNRKDWGTSYRFDDSNNDPIFKSFMQSGMARVIVTVRPGFEEAVQLYTSMGLLWNGGQTPVLGDPLYVSLIEEIKNAKLGKEGKAWITRLPTSLTILQAGSIGLVVEKALPCNCDDKDDFENPEEIPCDSNFELTDAELNQQKQGRIRFTFQGLDGYYGDNTIGNFDEKGMFPRFYECMGEAIIIDRNAAWSPSESTKVIFDILAEKLSLISGVSAEQVYNINSQNPDGICFTIDIAVIPDFVFKKTTNLSSYLPEFDMLRVISNDNNVRIIYDPSYATKNILDRYKTLLAEGETDKLLPISRFAY